MVKKLDSNPVYYCDSNKNIETQIKIYENNINKNFQGKNIPNESTLCKFLALIMLDSVIKTNSIFPKHFWKSVNIKWKKKQNKTYNSINDDFDTS